MIDRITIDSKIHFEKSCLAGTRITARTRTFCEDVRERHLQALSTNNSERIAVLHRYYPRQRPKQWLSGPFWFLH